MATHTEIDGSALDVASLVAYYKFTSGALTTDSGNGAGHALTAISVPTEDAGVLIFMNFRRVATFNQGLPKEII